MGEGGLLAKRMAAGGTSEITAPQGALSGNRARGAVLTTLTICSWGLQDAGHMRSLETQQKGVTAELRQHRSFAKSWAVSES